MIIRGGWARCGGARRGRRRPRLVIGGGGGRVDVCVSLRPVAGASSPRPRRSSSSRGHQEPDRCVREVYDPEGLDAVVRGGQAVQDGGERNRRRRGGRRRRGAWRRSWRDGGGRRSGRLAAWGGAGPVGLEGVLVPREDGGGEENGAPERRRRRAWPRRPSARRWRRRRRARGRGAARMAAGLGLDGGGEGRR